MGKMKENTNRVTKSELIELIAAETGMSKVKTKQFLNAFLKVVVDVLKEERTIYIRYFGYFFPKKIKERVINSPFRKGIVPEHIRYCFKFSDYCVEQLKQAEDAGK